MKLRGLAEERLEKIKKKKPKPQSGITSPPSGTSLPPSLANSGTFCFNNDNASSSSSSSSTNGEGVSDSGLCASVAAALAASSTSLATPIRVRSANDFLSLSSESDSSSNISNISNISNTTTDGESPRVPNTRYFVEELDFSDSPFGSEIVKSLKRYEGTTEFSPYEFQVAGHVALLKSCPQGRIFKPLKIQELGFYSVVADTYPMLLPFLPEFWGYVDVPQSALKKLFESVESTPIGTSPFENDSTNDWSPWSVQMHRALLMEINEFNEPSFPYLVIEDLTVNYSRPSVLDLKMGSKQFGDLSSEEKKLSKMRKSLSSTCSTVGFRISGMQLWDPCVKKYVHLHKYDGRSMTDKTLEQSLRNFFKSKQNGYRKDLVEVFLKKTKDLLPIVSTSPFRFYCTSLLLLYEGDPNYSTPNKVDIRMIDFAHTYPKGDRDDDSGYVFGLKSIIRMLENILIL